MSNHKKYSAKAMSRKNYCLRMSATSMKLMCIVFIIVGHIYLWPLKVMNFSFFFNDEFSREFQGWQWLET